MNQGKYTFRGVLGSGGFGVVYLISNNTGPKLAFKTVNILLLPDNLKKRAEDEVTILHKLNHKHLVRYITAYNLQHDYSHLLCIVTEFCEGGDLNEFLPRLGFSSGLPESLITCWLMQCCSALNYLHTRDPVVLHRDLKPQNIYLKESADIKLGDFGLARKLAGPDDLAHSMVGTLGYLSPEIINRQPYNSKTDIYSLGCMFYDLVCHKRSVETGPAFVYLQLAKGRKSPLPDNYSLGLRNTVTQMLSENHKDRPSAAKLLTGSFLQSFKKNPQKPLDIIHEHARKNNLPVPKLTKDLAHLKRPDGSLTDDDIHLGTDSTDGGLVTKAYNTAVQHHDTVADGGPRKVLKAGTDSTDGTEGKDSVDSGKMNTCEANEVDEYPTGASFDKTFFDSQTQPEYTEDYISKLKIKCIEKLGQDKMIKAFKIISDVTAGHSLEKILEDVLDLSGESQFVSKILHLWSLERVMQRDTSDSSTSAST